MRFYHAAPKETMMKIYAEGVLKKSWDGVVYMCKDPIDACKFLVIRGMRQMSVIELELDEKEVEESHDHSETFFKCKACRYYHCVHDRNGIYIPKRNMILREQLAQKAYNSSIINIAEEQLAKINKMLEIDADEKMKKMYDSLHPDRKKLINPIEDTWENNLQKWFAAPYQGKEFQEGAPMILTENGERVRSKSEKILADYFYRQNILYKYEKPLYLKGYGTVYPDFTFLSSKTGKEIYWEHEGMMDKQEYARNAVRKIELYQKNGIYPGERLILTFETEQSMLNQNILEKLVEKYL